MATVNMSLSVVRGKARNISWFVGRGHIVCVIHGKSNKVVGYIVGPDKVDALEGISTTDALMRDVYHHLGKLRRLVVSGTAVRIRDGNAARSKEQADNGDAVLFWFLPVEVWEGLSQDSEESRR